VELCSRVHGVHGRDIDNQSSIRLNTVELSVWGQNKWLASLPRKTFFSLGNVVFCPHFTLLSIKYYLLVTHSYEEETIFFSPCVRGPDGSVVRVEGTVPSGFKSVSDDRVLRRYGR